MWTLHVLSLHAWVFSSFSGFLLQSSNLRIRLIGDSKLSSWSEKIFLLTKSGGNHKLLFLAVSKEDSGGRAVALVILVTCPSVHEQDAEAHNAACDCLFLLIGKRCSNVSVNGRRRVVKVRGDQSIEIHSISYLGQEGYRFKFVLVTAKILRWMTHDTGQEIHLECKTKKKNFWCYKQR